MLADVVDAVVGGDTHRDTHTLALTAPSGVAIAGLSIGNDAAGFAEALAWIAEHAPGPRVVVALEGTRSYGIGLAGPCRPPGWRWWRSGGHGAASAAAARPIRSTPGWPRCTRCGWMPTGDRSRAPTRTGRRCAFCSAPAGS
jgi:hypothetical protein